MGFSVLIRYTLATGSANIDSQSKQPSHLTPDSDVDFPQTLCSALSPVRARSELLNAKPA